MSRHYSQEANQKTYSYAQLVGEAEARSKQVPQKKGGLEFMALRVQVYEKHLELAVTRKITPAEDNLLKLIELGTIGARNSRKQICSKAIFRISDLSMKLGYKEKDKIWKIVKSLHSKGYLIRDKTANKNEEVLGLDPKVFGQVLATKQHDIERKRHLSLVPDDHRLGADESSVEQTDRRSITDGSSVENRRIVGASQTDRRCSSSQDTEIIEEKPLLDSSRLILDSSRWQNRGRETNVSTGEWGKEASRKRSPEEHARILEEQLAGALSGKLIL